MTDFESCKAAGGLTLRIDTTRCAGYMACRSIAPEAFEMGDGGVITFREPEEVDRERLLQACRACPARALSAIDERGQKLAP